ncbi:unnamed protein product [Adineta steineri]|uniref:Protein kinase domain-containing protein n=2 Tax=Adineta steineri TaxID=433720 RepID=A0A818Q7N7_9BILA|nr:unnamed protein product [Adineta steineri]
MYNNIYWNQYPYYRSFYPLYHRKIWLINQTFRIKNQFYTLRERRGTGSFGSVWASTTLDGRRAAVKVFNLRKLRRNINRLALINSFKAEVEMTSSMRNVTNHVVNIYGFDFDGRTKLAFIAMELGDQTLQDRVKELHRMHSQYIRSGMGDDDYISARERKNIWIQLVHCDMKPANLVFFGPVLKVIDLGFAQKEIVGYNWQKLGGTPYLSALECMNGGAPVTSKADIWSVGAILYYLTYGTPPIYWTSQPPPGIPPTRSASVQHVLYQCLQQNPYQRPYQYQLAQCPLTSNPVIV